VYFANQSINTCAFISDKFKVGFKARNVNYTLLSLEVAMVIPLTYLVLHLTDSTQVTVDFLDFIWLLLVTIFVIIQHRLLGWNRQVGREPFQRVYVRQSLHRREVDAYLYCVFFTHLYNWLDTRPFNHIGENFIICEEIIVKLFLVLGLSLIFVDPN